MITQKIRRFPVIYAVRAFILSPLFVACMANFSAISPEEEALTLNPPEVVESAAPQYAPEIKMLPNKIDYPIGGAVREGDLEVKKRESSGAWTTVAYHTDYRGGNGFSISHSPFTSAGPQTVTITVHNYPDAGQTTSATYQVYVDSPAVQVYATEELQVLPLKTIYDCGASINPAGDVEVYKRDIYGRSITLSYPNEFAVSPITPLTAAGPVPITVLAGGGLFARYEVWVRPEAQSPLLVAAPGKVNYAVGGGIDPAADLAVFKRETDGAMTAVPSGGFTVTGPGGAALTGAGAFTAAMTGKVDVTVAVSGYAASATYPVWVSTPPAAQGPEAMVIPAKITYSVGGDPSINKAHDLAVYMRQADNAMALLPSAAFTVSPAAFTTSGEQTVTVTIAGYQGAALTYQVWVDAVPSQNLAGPELVVLPQKTIYVSGESVDPQGSGLLVYRRETTGLMTPLSALNGVGAAPDASQYAVTVTGYTGGVFTDSSRGRQTVTVTDGSSPPLTADYTIVVNIPDTPLYSEEALVIAPSKTVYDYNSPIDPASHLKVYRRNIWGEMSELSGYTITPSGALTVEGTNTITVTAAGGLYATYNILVLSAPRIFLTPHKTAYRLDDDSNNTFTTDDVTVSTVNTSLSTSNLSYSITGPSWSGKKPWNTIYPFPTGGTYTITVTLESGSGALSANYSVFVANAPDDRLGIIVYKANGGVGAGGVGADITEYFECFSSHTLMSAPTIGFTREHCTFAGWAESRAGTQLYSDQGTIPASKVSEGGTLTLYAKWNIIGSHQAVVEAAKNGDTITLTGVNWDYALPNALANVLNTTNGGITLDIGGVGGSITTWNSFALNSGKDKITNLILSDITTTVDGSAFTGWTNLESVKGPGVKDLADNAFSNHTKVKTVDFPALTSLGKSAFEGCTGLTAVNFPLLATPISEKAFSRCTLLITANIPKATGIEKFAFANSGLQIADFPEVTGMGENAFSECTSLTLAKLPKLQGSIPDGAFVSCSNLSLVIAPEVTKIGAAFTNCIRLTTANFPNVTEITGSNAFQGCNKLVTAIFPKAETVGYRAFAGCTSITSADFPLLKTLVGSTFTDCSMLAMVHLPLVKAIPLGTFSGCLNLTMVNLASAERIGDDVILNGVTQTAIDPVFMKCTKLMELSLPSSPPTLVAANCFEATGGGSSPLIQIHVGSAAAVTAYTTQWGVASDTPSGSDPTHYGSNHNVITIVP